jgi:hypothetical protein
MFVITRTEVSETLMISDEVREFVMASAEQIPRT